MHTLIRLLFVGLAAGLTALSAVAGDAPASDPFVGDWHTACIDCVHSFPSLSPHSAATAPDGTIHAVYGGDGLYHMAYDDGQWTVETVEGAGGDLRPPVMALDAAGRVHALYAAEPALDLYYARQTATGWQIEALSFDSFPYSDNTYSLVIDEAGEAHLAFLDTNGSELTYARAAGGSWPATVVAADTPGGNSITLDPQGRPAICYGNFLTHRLAVARFNGATWSTETVPSDQGEGDACDLAFAADGTLHVAHLGRYGLRHSVSGPGGWATETVDPGNAEDRQPGQSPSLRLDAGGAPHIAYTTRHQPGYPFPTTIFQTQHYAMWAPDGWQLETVDDTINAGGGTLLLDGGATRIVYRDRLGLALAERNGGWRSTPLDRSGDVGHNTSIAFDGFAVRVSHVDWQNQAVLYAAQSAGDWPTEVVDQGQLGQGPAFTRLGLGPTGAPHVIYNAFTPGFGLNYATRAPEGWTLDSLPGVGIAPYALAVDDQGTAHLVTARYPGGRLEYTPWPPGPDHPFEVIEPGGAGGYRMGLVAGPDGRLHAAYAGGGMGSVRHAVRDQVGVWSTETLFSNTLGFVAEVALALDGAGRPHAFFFVEGAGLFYASQLIPGDPWTVDKNLPQTEWASDLSIAVDHLGRVHLSYYDEIAGELIYARRVHDSLEWLPLPVGDAAGQGSSLALAPFGNPAIAYRAGEPGDLMLIYASPGEITEVYLPAVAP